MRIEVTQKHIDNGRACSSRHCAVALAIQEALGDYDSVSVRTQKAEISDRQIHLPAVVINFIERFDIHGKGSVQPFAFDLDLA